MNVFVVTSFETIHECLNMTATRRVQGIQHRCVDLTGVDRCTHTFNVIIEEITRTFNETIIVINCDIIYC